MSNLKNIFHSEFNEENRAHLLQVLEAGLKSMETHLPTNLFRDGGLAADDICMELMINQKAEFSWLDEVQPEFKKLYLEWVAANRKRIDTVLSRS